VSILKWIWRLIMRVIEILAELVGEDASVTFTVKRKSNGLAVAGATVTSGALNGVTDAQGKLTLSPFAEGSHNFTVSAVGFKAFSDSFEV
jgi:hypothetical protein